MRLAGGWRTHRRGRCSRRCPRRPRSGSAASPQSWAPRPARQGCCHPAITPTHSPSSASQPEHRMPASITALSPPDPLPTARCSPWASRSPDLPRGSAGLEPGRAARHTSSPPPAGAPPHHNLVRRTPPHPMPPRSLSLLPACDLHLGPDDLSGLGVQDEDAVVDALV